jgi:hypothetical protein
MCEKTFISYARTDAAFALRFAKDLRAAKIDVWIDQLDIRPGDMWDQAVETALRECTNLLLVLSPNSVASRSVMDEVAYALDENKRVLPVIYRQCTIPFRLRRVQFTDFSSGYDEALRRLIRGLSTLDPLQRTADELDSHRDHATTRDRSIIPRRSERVASWLSRHLRVKSAIFAGIYGSLITTTMLIPIVLMDDQWELPLVILVASIPVPFYMAAGAITGTAQLPRASAALTALILSGAWVTFILKSGQWTGQNAVDAAGAVLFGMPLGALTGAVIGRVFVYFRQDQSASVT